ncbi:hypothetical protein [Lentibacillus cibarius]|uniref:hypothetical protein n=1 Tax=Lentibacillus cibarius TaxID=2583219 RepID=UPI001F2764B7|nr:hypothetical protein [Lentibacillus cibarius]
MNHHATHLMNHQPDHLANHLVTHHTAPLVKQYKTKPNQMKPNNTTAAAADVLMFSRTISDPSAHSYPTL